MQRADLHLCRLARNTHGCAGKAIEEFSQFIEEAEVRHGMGQPHLPARTARAHAAQCRCDSVPRATATVQRYSLTANGSLSAETSRNFARQGGPLRQP